MLLPASTEQIIARESPTFADNIDCPLIRAATQVLPLNSTSIPDSAISLLILRNADANDVLVVSFVCSKLSSTRTTWCSVTHPENNTGKPTLHEARDLLAKFAVTVSDREEVLMRVAAKFRAHYEAVLVQFQLPLPMPFLRSRQFWLIIRQRAHLRVCATSPHMRCVAL